MKKYIFIVLILFSFPLFGQYEYKSIPTDSVRWMSRLIYNKSQNNIVVKDYEHFGTGEDTIIGGKTYQKIYDRTRWLENVSLDALPSLDIVCANQVDRYDFAIREEDKRVYILDPYEQEEEAVLYDFNLELGDTTVCNYWTPICGIVSNIDTIEISNSLRKRFTLSGLFNPDYEIYIIEGIGSSKGLYPGVYNSLGKLEMICMTHKGEAMVQSNSYNLCPEIREYTGEPLDDDCIEEEPVQPDIPSEIVVYPNPCDDYLSLYRIPEGGIDPITNIRVYNVEGKLMYERDRFYYNYLGTQISHWSAGVYFITYEQSGEKKTYSIVKR